MSPRILDAEVRAAWRAATNQTAQLAAVTDAWADGDVRLRYYTAADVLLDTVTHAGWAVAGTTQLYLIPGAILARTHGSAGTAAYCIAAIVGGDDILRCDVTLGAAVSSACRTNLGSAAGAGDGLRILANSSLPVSADLVQDDNLLNFNEGTATTGWSVTSGSGTLSQSGSSVRLTSTSAAVVGALSLAGPASNDCIILLGLTANYASGQYSTLRIKDGSTVMLELSFGYDHAANAETLGVISADDGTTGKVMATSVDYEAAAQKFSIHIDRNYSAVNVYQQHADGGWLFRCSFPYSSGFASLDSFELATSADNGQWIEYDWLGYARPNIISIGDSICAGHNEFDPDPTVYAGEDNPDGQWQRWCILFPALRNTLIVNKGIGSESSGDTLARIAWVTAHSPRLVFLHASTNDEVLSVTAATRTANIQDCIDAITTAGAACVLLNAMYGTSGNAINPDHRNYMASWWTSDRLALTGLYAAIDIMTQVASGDYMSGALTESDGIHPTPAGYEAIGEYIQAEML